MTDSKVGPEHLRRDAFVYIRQSTYAQVERNRESTRRQYGLVEHACSLGWDPARIRVLDEDLGHSGASTEGRDGCSRLAAEIALGRVGLVLGLEVSRLARNNADWYRLLDLCGVTDTLIGDADGLYHPALYKDRLLLGLKGNMSEAELHLLKGRLAEAIRAKAARGELRCALPVGYVWGREDGQVLLDPDDEVVGAVRSVFERFAALGSARRVWLWFLEQGLRFPMRPHPGAASAWLAPSEHTIRQVLANAVYAGAYVFGKTRAERYVEPDGTLRQRVVQLPQAEWRVLLPEHHEGYIDRPRTKRTARAWRRIGARARTAPGGRCGKAARCCKGSRCAGSAGAVCKCNTAPRRRRSTSARGPRRRTAGPGSVSGSAGRNSTGRWRRRSWRRCGRPGWRRRCWRPSAWSRGARRRWSPGGWRSSGPGARRRGQRATSNGSTRGTAGWPRSTR